MFLMAKEMSKEMELIPMDQAFDHYKIKSWKLARCQLPLYAQ